MSEKPRDNQTEQPRRGAAANRAAEEREARLATALRANLRRRKAQARERDPEPAADDPKS